MVKRISERERRRLRTVRQRYGENKTKEIARAGGMATPSKFNPETASRAAKIRWEKYYAEKAERKRQHGTGNQGTNGPGLQD